MRQRLTPEIGARARQLKQDGWTYRQIAAELGVAVGSVGHAIHAGAPVQRRRPLPMLTEEELRRFHTEPAPNPRPVAWGGIKPPPLTGEYSTCPECHCRVLMPCLACQLRSQGFARNSILDDDLEPADDDSAVRLPKEPTPDDSAVSLPPMRS